MDFVLYGDPGSGSAIVELILADIGAAVELRDVSLENDRQRDAAYATLNPQRKLPALLLADGTLLTESAAIALTLADMNPDAALLPPDPARRAAALRWLLFMATELYPVIEMHDYPQRFQPELDRTPAERRVALSGHAREIWKTRFLLVERAASGNGWFMGDRRTLVDYYAAVLSRWGRVGDWRAENLPKIDAIAMRIAGADRTSATWQRHFGQQES